MYSFLVSAGRVGAGAGAGGVEGRRKWRDAGALEPRLLVLDNVRGELALVDPYESVISARLPLSSIAHVGYCEQAIEPSSASSWSSTSSSHARRTPRQPRSRLAILLAMWPPQGAVVAAGARDEDGGLRVVIVPRFARDFDAINLRIFRSPWTQDQLGTASLEASRVLEGVESGEEWVFVDCEEVRSFDRDSFGEQAAANAHGARHAQPQPRFAKPPQDLRIGISQTHICLLQGNRMFGANGRFDEEYGYAHDKGEDGEPSLLFQESLVGLARAALLDDAVVLMQFTSGRIVRIACAKDTDVPALVAVLMGRAFYLQGDLANTAENAVLGWFEGSTEALSRLAKLAGIKPRRRPTRQERRNSARSEHWQEQQELHPEQDQEDYAQHQGDEQQNSGTHSASQEERRKERQRRRSSRRNSGLKISPLGSSARALELHQDRPLTTQSSTEGTSAAALSQVGPEIEAAAEVLARARQLLARSPLRTDASSGRGSSRADSASLASRDVIDREDSASEFSEGDILHENRQGHLPAGLDSNDEFDISEGDEEEGESDIEEEEGSDEEESDEEEEEEQSEGNGGDTDSNVYKGVLHKNSSNTQKTSKVMSRTVANEEPPLMLMPSIPPQSPTALDSTVAEAAQPAPAFVSETPAFSGVTPPKQEAPQLYDGPRTNEVVRSPTLNESSPVPASVPLPAPTPIEPNAEQSTTQPAPSQLTSAAPPHLSAKELDDSEMAVPGAPSPLASPPLPKVEPLQSHGSETNLSKSSSFSGSMDEGSPLDKSMEIMRMNAARQGLSVPVVGSDEDSPLPQLSKRKQLSDPAYKQLQQQRRRSQPYQQQSQKGVTFDEEKKRKNKRRSTTNCKQQ